MSRIDKRDSKGRIAKGSNLKHGLSNHPVYDCWVAMKARCNKPHHPSYKHYGGRGIGVCKQWQSFDRFLADMGVPAPGLTLDRIDVDGDYSPSSCRWVTIQQQQKNKRNSRQHVGVSVDPKYVNSPKKKWRAEIRYLGVRYYLGLFDNELDAYKVRLAKEAELWATSSQLPQRS